MCLPSFAVNAWRCFVFGLFVSEGLLAMRDAVAGKGFRLYSPPPPLWVCLGCVCEDKIVLSFPAVCPLKQPQCDRPIMPVAVSCLWIVCLTMQSLSESTSLHSLQARR
jgi:hypothetical protein